ncbi:MAG TPA: hypothetical protein VF405_06515 [Gammaproteobacteria bacterium]
MAEPVELRADLAELGAHDLVVKLQSIRAHRAERLRNFQAEVARAEQRHARFVDVPELIHGAARDEALRLEHLLRRDAVRGAALVFLAPARRAGISRLTERDTGHGRR